MSTKKPKVVFLRVSQLFLSLEPKRVDLQTTFPKLET